MRAEQAGARRHHEATGNQLDVSQFIDHSAGRRAHQIQPMFGADSYLGYFHKSIETHYNFRTAIRCLFAAFQLALCHVLMCENTQHTRCT